MLGQFEPVLYRCHSELTLDTSAVTIPISEMSPYRTTASETGGGNIALGTGFTSSSVHDLNPATTHSVLVHRQENAASPNLPSTARASHHPMASSTVASIPKPPVRRKRRTYSCRACKVNFVQIQGFNRHNRDEHQPPNICAHCGVFTWSPARNYLFTKHLKRDHPGVTL